MRHAHGSLATALAAAWTFTGAAHAGQPKVPLPSLSTNSKQICLGGSVDRGLFLQWLFFNSTDLATQFPTLSELSAAFSAPEGQTGANASMVRFVQGEVQAQYSSASIDTDAFLAGKSVVLKCEDKKPPAGEKPAPTQTAQAGSGTSGGLLDAIRIRGTPDSLLVDRKDAAFASATSATLSLSDNGLSKTSANVFQAAVGFRLPLPSAPGGETDIIPFAAVDRSITSVAGKDSTSNRENVTLGVTASLAPPPAVSLQTAFTPVFSATYEHIFNDIDNSQLNYAHFVYQPYLDIKNSCIGINEYKFLPSCVDPNSKPFLAYSILFDARADVGSYSDRGPATNTDYTQIGTRFGMAVSIKSLNSDLTIDKVYMGQTRGPRPTISLWEANWTYNIVKTYLGLKFSYQDGDLEATGQKTQQWTVSLSAKY